MFPLLPLGDGDFGIVLLLSQVTAILVLDF